MALNNIINSNLFDKSMFTKKSYSDILSENGAYSITITPKASDQGWSVLGILREGINLSLSSEWESTAIGTVTSSIPLVEKYKDKADSLLALGGKRLNASGFLTEKFFNKGGYLEISPEIRVVNWNDDGMPLLSTLILLQTCVPKGTGNVSLDEVLNLAKGVIDSHKVLGYSVGALTSLAGKVLGGGEKLVEGASKKTQENLTQAVNTELSNSGKQLQSTLSKSIDRLNNAKAEITNSPTTVNVRISNFMNYTNMIVESLDVKFSKEMTKTGPLYADFSLKLSSKQMPTYNDMGMSIPHIRYRNLKNKHIKLG